MSDGAYYFGLVLVLLGVFVVALWHEERKPKTAPNHARLVAKPGATLDLVTKDGRFVARLVCKTISHNNRDGTTAEFVDYDRYMEARTYHG